MSDLVRTKKEYLLKVLVIGEYSTGKTSIIQRYVHAYFTERYKVTIGVDFALKILELEDDLIVRIQLWDIAGQERHGQMTRVYYKDALGAFVVFDVTRQESFELVKKWKHDLDSKVFRPDGENIAAVLLCNKCDKTSNRPYTVDSLNKFCKEHNFKAWFETSARTGDGIEPAATFLVTEIIKFLSEQAINEHNERTDLISVAYERKPLVQPKKSCKC